MKLAKDLLTIVDNKAVPSPYAKTVLEFKDLDAKSLAYVYFMVDYRSPYAVYEWEQRKTEVKNSIFAKKWKETPKVKTACDKYAELTETSAVKLLKAARESIIKLEKYFRDIDLTLMDDNGKPIFHAKDLINNLEKMGKVVDGLSRLEDIVRKEEQANNSNRGGVEVNKYSM
tara:strand:+ start:2861 stop:3376 length:516 start_codon:yes stop_codon:yes gene_type:complete